MYLWTQEELLVWAQAERLGSRFVRALSETGMAGCAAMQLNDADLTAMGIAMAPTRKKILDSIAKACAAPGTGRTRRPKFSEYVSLCVGHEDDALEAWQSCKVATGVPTRAKIFETCEFAIASKLQVGKAASASCAPYKFCKSAGSAGYVVLAPKPSIADESAIEIHDGMVDWAPGSEGRRLPTMSQWAIDVPVDRLAKIGQRQKLEAAENYLAANYQTVAANYQAVAVAALTALVDSHSGITNTHGDVTCGKCEGASAEVRNGLSQIENEAEANHSYLASSVSMLFTIFFGCCSCRQ